MLDSDLADVGIGMVVAPACGEVMRLQISVNGQGVIEGARFGCDGRRAVIAPSSLLTELVQGKTLDQACQIRNSQIAEEPDLPPVIVRCLVLPEGATKAAIRDYQSERPDDQSTPPAA